MILVLDAMAELEVVSQYEIKGFIYTIQTCHFSANSEVIEYEISSQEYVISDDHTYWLLGTHGFSTTLNTYDEYHAQSLCGPISQHCVESIRFVSRCYFLARCNMDAC